MDTVDLFGLQARLADRTRYEETGEVSYVVVGRGEERCEVPIPRCEPRRSQAV